MEIIAVFRDLGFRHNGDETCALLGDYAASNVNHLLTFRDNVSAPSSRVFLDFLTLEDGADTLSETWVKDYHSTLPNSPEERRSNWRFV
jgi:hypothetical protein